eukprot:CAMPEP_0194273288 /NCGR_PEP_ID=MMETSP0169-20130528/6653_1 /TAXON_ID=218684 /ORGANISM="Corethron pennatum, Strain L29A3" /LENGTH=244 /DNA_ID=CAMNT_0039016191 /DNA_START=263 /DNA_END=995 /DNA_ORIENTATION=+
MGNNCPKKNLQQMRTDRSFYLMATGTLKAPEEKTDSVVSREHEEDEDQQHERQHQYDAEVFFPAGALDQQLRLFREEVQVVGRLVQILVHVVQHLILVSHLLVNVEGELAQTCGRRGEHLEALILHAQLILLVPRLALDKTVPVRAAARLLVQRQAAVPPLRHGAAVGPGAATRTGAVRTGVGNTGGGRSASAAAAGRRCRAREGGSSASDGLAADDGGGGGGQRSVVAVRAGARRRWGHVGRW